jgi:hypothetical protein
MKYDGWSIEDATLFVNKEIEGPDSIIEGGLLPEEAVAVVGGISKLGKSVFVMNLGMCVSQGRPFLLQFNVPKREKVLYVQSEISPKSMQNRLRKMLGPDTEEGWFFIYNVKGLLLHRQRDLDHLSDVVEAHQPKIVIIDPLYKFHTLDENKAGDMTKLLNCTDILISRHGVSLVIVHHHGKPAEGKREGAHQLRGSSIIADYGDSYFTLNRKSSREPRSYIRLSFELRNDEDPAPMYLYRDPETLWYEVLDEEVKGAVTIHDVVSTVNNLGGNVKRAALIKAIKDMTGRSERTVIDAITKAVTIKKVVRIVGTEKGNPISYRLPGQQDLIPF